VGSCPIRAGVCCLPERCHAIWFTPRSACGLLLTGVLAVLLPCLVPAAPKVEPAAQIATDGPIDARVRNEVLAELARQLESRYVSEDVAKKLAASVRLEQKSNAYRDITSGPELARALTEHLRSIAHDKHLRVSYSFTPLQQRPAGPPSPQEMEQLRKLNGAIAKVEILDGNVGYMRVNGVPPVELARPAVAAAFAFLHNTDALILDNRTNGGGDPNTVALYVSYLSEGAPFIVNTFHWREGNRVDEFRTTDLGELAYGKRKPVFVLTSPGTFSGGEELAYDLQALKRGVLVGEVTGGGANPGGPVPLGHQFAMNMPGGRPVNPVTGTNWEGVGVKPDVPVPAAASLGKAHALAIERLVAEATDPESRSMLSAVLVKLSSVEEAESGKVTRLSNAELIGTYVLEAGAGAAVTITEHDGQLVQHVDGLPEVQLVYLKGNRYKPNGLPDGAFTSFHANGNKMELLLEVPWGPPTLRVKRLPPT
jgi:hypothetical protein